ncbi:MAG: diguanylate cyclase [Candidatus Omnitrophica bacterium]|nr:diguanylate cyclase [Candidatus Omnitrophota bacterium]
MLDIMKRQILNYILKICVVAVYAVVVLAYPVNASGTRTGSSVSEVSGAGISFDTDSFYIPSDIGYVDDAHKGDSGHTLFLIKDAHCNYGAQKSIAGIIDWIVRRYGVSLVNLEGASGKYDLSLFEDITDTELKESISGEYLRQGKLNGPEWYRIFNPEKVVLEGIEDPGLYKLNLACYDVILEYRPEIDEFLSFLNELLEEEKNNSLNKDLLELIAEKEKYESKDIDLGEYLLFLSSRAVSHSIDLSEFPNISLMGELLFREKDIDFEKAEKEKNAIVERTMSRLSRSERRHLLYHTAAAHDEMHGKGEYFSYIASKSRETGLSPDEYAQFHKYAEYAGIYGKMDNLALYDEISMLEEKVEKALCVRHEEDILYGLIEQAGLLERIFSLSVDRRKMRKAAHKINIDRLLRYAADKIDDPEKYKEIENAAVHTMHSYFNMLKFYRLSDERNKAFVRNIRKNMLYNETGKSIVITGGFHHGDLARLLRREGVSYVSITPSFSNTEGYVSPYMDIIGGKTDAGSLQLLGVLASNIQVPSIWSKLGIDANFMITLIERINAELEVQKRQGTEEILFEIGDRKIFFSKSMDYQPNVIFPTDYQLRENCKVINCRYLLDMPAPEFRKKLTAFFMSGGRRAFLKMLQEEAQERNIPEQLIEIMGSNVLRRVLGEGLTPKKALFKPNGHIVEYELRGTRGQDDYTYIYDLKTQKLNAIASVATMGAESGYMNDQEGIVEGSESIPPEERSEKWYLCNSVWRVFRSGLTAEQRKRELRKLLEEQHEYESMIDEEGEHKCGWEWEIDHEDGEIYYDESSQVGLRSLRIYDRFKLPKGIYPRKMDRDALIFGGIENVQEMTFHIVKLQGDKVWINLTNNWPAEQLGHKYEQQAHKDEVSSLPNKRFFHNVILPELISRGSESLPVGVLFVDGDDFKRYNDEYNHTVGDEIIRAIAEAIRKSVRHSDHILNWGGDEFIIILPGTLATNAKAVANTICEQIKRIDFREVLEKAGYEKKTGKKEETVSGTIGVAMASTQEEIKDLDRIIDAADDMLKMGKRTKKGSVLVLSEYSEMQSLDASRSFAEVQVDRMPIDLKLILDQYLPAFENNLRTFINRDYLRGMPQGEAIKGIYEEFSEDRYLARTKKKLSDFRKEFAEDGQGPGEETVQNVKKSMRALYSKLFYYKLMISEAIGDRPASRNVSTAIANIGDALYVSYRYVMKDWEEIEGNPSPSREWSDPAGNVITLPSFGSLLVSDREVPREDKVFTGEYSGIAELTRTALGILRSLLDSERRDGYEDPLLEDHVFTEYAGHINDSIERSAKRSEKNLRAVEEGAAEFKKWITRLAMDNIRFPEEMRVIVYPVYSESVYAREKQLSFELRRQMLRENYSHKVLPMPYLAGDPESRFQAVENMTTLLEEEKEGRAVLYTDEEGFKDNSSRLKGLFGDRVLCVKEEGTDSVMGDFTFMSLALRSALSLSLIDYFMPEEKNNLKAEQRERLKDLIAAMIGIITSDNGAMQSFREDPSRLIEGLLILKPARKINWEAAEEKIEAERQFVYSL